MRAPAKGLGQLEPVAVHRAQLDDADAVELRQVLDALGLAQAVGGQHLLQSPLAEHADGHQQQLLVGHHRLLLLLRQLLDQGLVVGHTARQVGKIQAQHVADGIDARQRHVTLGQHPLDAGLRHAQRLGQVGIGHLRGFQLFLQCQYQIGGGAHGYRPVILWVPS